MVRVSYETPKNGGRIGTFKDYEKGETFCIKNGVLEIYDEEKNTIVIYTNFVCVEKIEQT